MALCDECNGFENQCLAQEVTKYDAYDKVVKNVRSQEVDYV
jgi:hypothetical protein